MRASTRMTENAILLLADAIRQAEGNEVLAIGRLDGEGKVGDVEVASRGSVAATLVPDSFLERGDVLIHNHPSANLSPSDADLAVSARAAEFGVGSFIVDNDVRRVYVVAEPARRVAVKPLDGDLLVSALEEGGAIARRLSPYEPRPAQLGLLRLVAKAFNDDGIAVAEAGTGVGKSFAYLVPAMAWASSNDERVVLSTATINLQQQLYEKDIPLVSSAMRKKVKAVLIKGRSNYLCFRRLDEARREKSLFPDEEQGLDAIEAWAGTTADGSRSDLPFLPDEALWSKVCAEADLCLGGRCPERERCFVMRVRREAADARVLVVNHHLLFADLSARKSGAGYESTVVLPPYRRIVIDEAHSIEEAATSFFSEGFSRPQALKQLGRLYRRKRGSETGLALRLAALAGDGSKRDDLAEAAMKAREAFEKADDEALAFLGGEGARRLSGPPGACGFEPLAEVLSNLRKALSEATAIVRDLVEGIPESDREDFAVWEAKAVARRLDSIGSVCASFLDYADRPEEVFWLESARGARGDVWARLNATPLEVSTSLRDSLFAPNRTVACVSATLSVAGSFAYWLRRSGAGALADRPVSSGEFPSPFPYDKSVLLAVPTDGPLPEEGGFREFVDAAATRLVMVSGGSALILFTSYEAMRSAYAAALPELSAAGIRCLKQGDDDRARLLRTFLYDESSVLFATDSFWEGVDAPGDTLRLVVICRLPFRSPNDPVFEARREALEARGGNAFMELSIPESVMHFKQGFGRLMRRSSDRGVVVVLDGRLLRKRYGELFLRSLPQTKRCFAPLDAVAAEIESFLY